MAKKISKWKKFKRFLKRNMTPTWARHFSYQVFALLTSIAMIVGVADYAVTKSYDERKLSFMDDFTITAHTGAYDTEMNTLEAVKAAIKNNAEIIELDIRQRPNKTLVMSHDIVVTNNDGSPLEDALALIKDTPDMQINFDIKETRVLNSLHALLVDYNLPQSAITFLIISGSLVVILSGLMTSIFFALRSVSTVQTESLYPFL
jgi:hypothetical protein